MRWALEVVLFAVQGRSPLASVLGASSAVLRLCLLW